MTTGTAITLLLTYRYWIVFPLAIIEGPILAMLCGFLVHLRLFDFWPLFAVFYAADLVGDIGWYWIGRRYGHGFIARYGRYISITEEHVATVTKVFHRYHNPILLVSKVTMGLGFPGAVLFTAGLSKIPFGRYMALNMIGQVVWTGFLMGIGYYLGHFYEQISGAIGLVSSLVIMAIILAALFGFARFVRAEITKKVQ